MDARIRFAWARPESRATNSRLGQALGFQSRVKLQFPQMPAEPPHASRRLQPTPGQSDQFIDRLMSVQQCGPALLYSPGQKRPRKMLAPAPQATGIVWITSPIA